MITIKIWYTNDVACRTNYFIFVSYFYVCRSNYQLSTSRLQKKKLYKSKFLTLKKTQLALLFY